VLSRRVVAAFALLIGAWLLSPAVMPLYDGPNNPDERYRYVSPPPGYPATKPATTATASAGVRDGVNADAVQLASQEQGPQVSVYVPAGSLRAPAGATTIQVTATPSAPQPPLPADGTIVGDVYTVTASAPGGDVTVIGKGDNHTPVIQMRAPTGRQPGPVFETFDGKKWRASETIRVLQDVYQTFAPKLGVWALVQQNTTASAGIGGAQLVMLVLGIAILAIVGIIVVVRLMRSRAGRA